jgi:hypothetical protein
MGKKVLENLFLVLGAIYLLGLGIASAFDGTTYDDQGIVVYDTPD